MGQLGRRETGPLYLRQLRGYVFEDLSHGRLDLALNGGEGDAASPLLTGVICEEKLVCRKPQNQSSKSAGRDNRLQIPDDLASKGKCLERRQGRESFKYSQANGSEPAYNYSQPRARAILAASIRLAAPSLAMDSER
jgi:hypothetical protein